MRIDYSEPKKSCSSPQTSQNRPRKESSGFGLIMVFTVSVLSLGIGFGSGWTLSQRATKKGFKAAMEQQSLENSSQQAVITAPAQKALTDGSVQPPAAADGIKPAVDPPLSFYKTLPGGQKNNVMGSGINSMDDKPAKQPLQAAVPTNIARPAPPQGDETAQKLPAQTGSAKVARQDPNGLTVQIGSYSLKSEAETMRGKLSAKGYNVSIVESHLGDKGIWYRVRVGKRLDPDAARELAVKLGKGAIAIPDKE